MWPVLYVYWRSRVLDRNRHTTLSDEWQGTFLTIAYYNSSFVKSSSWSWGRWAKDLCKKTSKSGVGVIIPSNCVQAVVQWLYFTSTGSWGLKICSLLHIGVLLALAELWVKDQMLFLLIILIKVETFINIMWLLECTAI